MVHVISYLRDKIGLAQSGRWLKFKREIKNKNKNSTLVFRGKCKSIIDWKVTPGLIFISVHLTIVYGGVGKHQIYNEKWGQWINFSKLYE